jgi:hypothetical protein
VAPDALFSPQQVAELYGISIAHVWLLARSRHLGQVIGDEELVFSSADVVAMRPRGYRRPWVEREATWDDRA